MFRYFARLFEEYSLPVYPMNPSEKRVFEQRVAESAPPEQEQVMEMMTSWELEGLEKGRVEGRVEGRTEEAQSIALRLLRKRIGALTETQEAQIRRLPLKRLEDLADALLDFTDAAELEAWLKDTAESEE